MSTAATATTPARAQTSAGISIPVLKAKGVARSIVFGLVIAALGIGFALGRLITF